MHRAAPTLSHWIPTALCCPFTARNPETERVRTLSNLDSASSRANSEPMLCLEGGGGGEGRDGCHGKEVRGLHSGYEGLSSYQLEGWTKYIK